jgi:hypothetical protein
VLAFPLYLLFRAFYSTSFALPFLPARPVDHPPVASAPTCCSLSVGTPPREGTAVKKECES